MRRVSSVHRSAESRRRLEVLETRSVMAITCALADGTLTVCGTDPSDQVAVVAQADAGAIHVLGTDNSIVASYSAADVQQIDIQAAGGNDAVRYDAALASLVSLSGANNAGVAAPAAPVRATRVESVNDSHQHAAAEPVVAESHAHEETKAAAPVSDSSAQLLVALPAATVNYTAASANAASQSSPSSVTVATDRGTSSVVHTHGADSAQALSAAPSASATGHEGHGGSESGITTATSAVVTATSITNPIVSAAMSGSTGGSRSSTSDGAKSCELKTTFKSSSATLYTKYECKCNEKRWSSKKARAAAAVDNEESGPKNLALRGPLSLIWDGGYDTCTESDTALDEFARMQTEYANSAAEAMLPAVEIAAPVAEEAGTDYFQILGMTLFSVGAVGLVATQIPSARKREEEERAFRSLELLAR